MVSKVLDNSYTAKSIAANLKDERTISIIIDSLEEQKTKMLRMQHSIEEIGRKI